MFVLTLISCFLGETPEAFQSGQGPAKPEAQLLEPFERCFLLLSSSLQKDCLSARETLCVRGNKAIVGRRYLAVWLHGCAMKGEADTEN